MKRFFGVALAVLAIGLATVPFFTDCTSHEEAATNTMGSSMSMSKAPAMHMRCYGNRAAEVGVAAPLFAVGIVMAFAKLKSKPALLSLSAVFVLAGVAGILMPTTLVGTCSGPTMFCNTVEKPALLGISSLVVAGGVGSLLALTLTKSPATSFALG